MDYKRGFDLHVSMVEGYTTALPVSFIGGQQNYPKDSPDNIPITVNNGVTVYTSANLPRLDYEEYYNQFKWLIDEQKRLISHHPGAEPKDERTYQCIYPNKFSVTIRGMCVVMSEPRQTPEHILRLLGIIDLLPIFDIRVYRELNRVFKVQFITMVDDEYTFFPNYYVNKKTHELTGCADVLEIVFAKLTVMT
jgi:hypothetical protein